MKTERMMAVQPKPGIATVRGISRSVPHICGLIVLLLLALPAQAQHIPSWLNVQDFGAKGDSQTDDSAAILAAVHAANGQFGGSVVYFPPTKGGYYSGGYAINSPLTLPSTNIRTILFFDSQLQLNAPLTIGDNYTLRGNTPAGKVAFATDSTTRIEAGYNLTGPAVHVHGAGIQLENLQFNVHGSHDGVLVDGSAQIRFRNVWVGMDGANLTGVPLKIIGGFGYYFDGGGFSAAWNGTQPSIQFDGDPRLNWSGIFRMRDTFFSGHGIIVNALGGTNSMSFDNILFESARTPFLALNSNGYSGIWGIDLKGVNFADAQQGYPIVQAKGIRIRKISIRNCWTEFNSPMCKDDGVNPVTELIVE